MPKAKKIRFTKKEYRQMYREGYGLFDDEPGEHTVELEPDAEVDAFTWPADVYRYVAKTAEHGNKLSQKVLAYIYYEHYEHHCEVLAAAGHQPAAPPKGYNLRPGWAPIPVGG